MGIPALNDLFVLEPEPVAGTSKGVDEEVGDDEDDNDSGEGLGSAEVGGKVPAETEDVEMAEVVNTVGGSDA